MHAATTTPQAVLDWIRDCANHHTVFFPMKQGKVNFTFQPVKGSSALQWEPYRPTVTPPVKFMFPSRDPILRFQRRAGGGIEVEAQLDQEPRILAGVRPCDLKGIALMDLAFADGIADPFYLARRQATTIIAFDCIQPCDERAFCAATKALGCREGADLFVTRVGTDQVVVQAFTQAGEGLLESASFDALAEEEAHRLVGEVKRTEPFGRPLDAPVELLPSIIESHWKSPVWEKHVERCFSCGTCNLVCPTCYCYDMNDEDDLLMNSGARVRTWDSCMLRGFTEVAGGHVFRLAAANRQRHRIKRKFEYLPQRFEKGSFCVGCGRCGRQCTADIDILDIVNDLVKAEVAP